MANGAKHELLSDVRHHGKFLKRYLESNNISKAQFENMCKKSHAWVYELFNTSEFSLSQVGIVSLVLSIPPKTFGEEYNRNTVIAHPAPPDEVENEESLRVKIQQLQYKNQLLEKQVSFLENLVNYMNNLIKSFLKGVPITAFALNGNEDAGIEDN